MMARIDSMQPREVQRVSVQSPVEAGYTIFEADGATFLQIVTYGSTQREVKGVVSQTIQFGPEGIAALRSLLDRLP